MRSAREGCRSHKAASGYWRHWPRARGCCHPELRQIDLNRRSRFSRAVRTGVPVETRTRDLLTASRKAGQVSSLPPGASPASLRRVGNFTAIGIAIHNFPEGMITYTSAAAGDMTFGIMTAMAGRYGREHPAILGITAGRGIMAPSLWLPG